MLAHQLSRLSGYNRAIQPQEQDTTMPKTKQSKNEPGISDEFTIVEISQIHPSPFAPQAKRRERFTEEEINELAESIRQKGLINPITIRRNAEGFELVAGERRWRASQQAGLTQIPAVIRRLTDEDALEIQLLENLQRKDVHPLDEAVWYQHLLETKGANLAEVSLIVGRTEKYIANRLKLNSLIDEAAQDYQAGKITTGHALEIARLPLNVQKDALHLCYGTNSEYKGGKWVYTPDKDELYPVHKVRRNIGEKLLLKLSLARFDITATNLRKDKLACTDCPERTGAAALLFSDLTEDKEDQCLNKICFHNKLFASIKITRKQLSAEAVESGKPADYKIPLLSWYSKYNSIFEETEKLFKETPLTDSDCHVIKTKGDNCKSSEKAVYVNGNTAGEIVQICRDAKCAKHRRSTSSSSSSGEKTEAEKIQFYERKQEIFDIKVAEPVRLTVLRMAAEKFAAGELEKRQQNPVFDRQLFETSIGQWLWLQLQHTEETVKVITGILLAWEIPDVPDLKRYDYGNPSHKKIKIFLSGADDLTLFRLQFLLLNAFRGSLHNASYWKDQSEIIQLAKNYEINYQLLDAKERLIQSPKKYKLIAQEYLTKVENGEDAAKPVFYKLEK